MLMIDGLILKEIGKGKTSSIFVAVEKNGASKYIAKMYENKQIISNGYAQNLKNEYDFSQMFNHPNILKTKAIKKTQNHLYIFYEYFNGGNLSYFLEEYQKKHVYSFPPIIIQHLMRQIVQAFLQIHKSGFIHRNIKLNNIFVHFDNDQDKANLNMMKSKIKVGGFQYCVKNSKNLLIQNISDPKRCPSQKKDIFNLGIICFQMIFGKNYAIDCDIEKFINDIERGKVYYPITLTKELISFLKCMLRNYSTKIVKIDELSNHEFLRQDLRNSVPLVHPASHSEIKKIIINPNPLISTSNGISISNNIYNKRQ